MHLLSRFGAKFDFLSTVKFFCVLFRDFWVRVDAQRDREKNANHLNLVGPNGSVPFAALEHKNMSHYVSKLHKIHRFPDLEVQSL